MSIENDVPDYRSIVAVAIRSLIPDAKGQPEEVRVRLEDWSQGASYSWDGYLDKVAERVAERLATMLGPLR